AGRLGRAEKTLLKIETAHPGVPDVLHLLGVIALQTDRPDLALKHLEGAVAAAPRSPELLTLLGSALRGTGKVDAAIEVLEKAQTLAPDRPDILYTLGNALINADRLDDAADRFGRAVQLAPDYADAHYNLGRTLRRLGRMEDARGHYEKAVALTPNQADALNGLGATLNDLNRPDAALPHLLRAVELEPKFADAHGNLANTYTEIGDTDAAIGHLKEALKLNPNDPRTGSNLIMGKSYSPDYGPGDILAEARRWNERHAAPLQSHIEPHSNAPGPDRRLKVGYVSADFRRHPVGYFFEGALAAHDKQGFEIFCYANSPAADEVTERFRSHADHWRDITGLDDDAAARRVRDDGIDILVDLTGHTGKNRLLLFARKPAPVQATGGGLFSTTGMDAMDYILTDRFEVPEGYEQHYSETVRRLPHGYVCYTPPDYAAAVPGLPAAANGFITFGCFNTLAKISADAVALWGQVLDAVPGSKLLLRTHALKSPAARERLSDDRFIFKDGLPHKDLLKAYAEIDIALDPLPYSGGLTTVEALWMGVPVVTLSGETFASRHSTSHLSNVGLTELVTDSPEGYVSAAAGLAGDLGRLAELRAGLRARMKASPLCDTKQFARDLETAYRGLWRTWCKGAGQ
ncbi:MAG TPA: tetratricopeptide repeat protein, partial [Rhodospirillales bacterium]|nr:tetratricopeptide repeat protein [Rhodospirillales bacterium]